LFIYNPVWALVAFLNPVNILVKNRDPGLVGLIVLVAGAWVGDDPAGFMGKVTFCVPNPSFPNIPPVPT